MARRNRDAGTGKIVSAKDAKARPRETVAEDTGKARAIADLIARIERIELAMSLGGAAGKAMFRNQGEQD